LAINQIWKKILRTVLCFSFMLEPVAEIWQIRANFKNIRWKCPKAFFQVKKMQKKSPKTQTDPNLVSRWDIYDVERQSKILSGFYQYSPLHSLVGYNWRFQLQLVKTKPKMDGSDFWNWF
jgi:hypothetical protein